MIDFTKFEHMISFLNGLYLGKNTFFKIYDKKIPILGKDRKLLLSLEKNDTLWPI